MLTCVSQMSDQCQQVKSEERDTGGVFQLARCRRDVGIWLEMPARLRFYYGTAWTVRVLLHLVM